MIATNGNAQPASRDAVQMGAEHLQKLMAFATDLVPATDKALKNFALTRNDRAYMALVEDVLLLDYFNPRAEEEELWAHIRQLADDMKERGFDPDSPIVVVLLNDGKRARMYAIGGNSRMRAVHLANSEGATIQEVPIIVSGQATSMDDLLVKAVRFNNNKRHTPMDLMGVCERLHRSTNGQWSNERIAQAIGVNKEYVRQLLLLSRAGSDIHKMVLAGQVSAALAIRTVTAHGQRAAEVLQQTLNRLTADSSAGSGAAAAPAQTAVAGNLVDATTPADSLALAAATLGKAKASVEDGAAGHELASGAGDQSASTSTPLAEARKEAQVDGPAVSAVTTAVRVKITASQTDEGRFKKLVIKTAPSLIQAVRAVRADASYKDLPGPLRAALDEVMNQIDAADHRQLENAGGDGPAASGAETKEENTKTANNVVADENTIAKADGVKVAKKKRNAAKPAKVQEPELTPQDATYIAACQSVVDARQASPDFLLVEAGVGLTEAQTMLDRMLKDGVIGAPAAEQSDEYPVLMDAATLGRRMSTMVAHAGAA